MAMELSPNMGAGSKQFECKLCTFSGHFAARNGFLVQVKPVGKYYGCWIFVYHYLERNVDMGMHAILDIMHFFM